VGATTEEAGFDTGVTDAAQVALRAAAEKLMPGLRGWSVTEQWAGLRPRAPDGLPMLGPSKVEGLWVASGQFRNGILYAPGMADTLRDQILDRAPGIAAFDPRRFAA
jgi:glycine oxidase